MNPTDFDYNLAKYADLLIRVGLNLQPGQRLMIGSPIFDTSPLVSQAPLVRFLVTKAYQAGARYVDVMWGDQELQHIRMRHAGRETLSEYPLWRAQACTDHLRNGDAILSIKTFDPDIWQGYDPEAVKMIQKADVTHSAEIRELITHNASNWCVVAAPSMEWAQKVFPQLPPQDAYDQMWETVFRICRVTADDPVAAWKTHIDQLGTRRDYLNAKRYRALKLKAPGTDLTVGLPAGHLWGAGAMTAKNGIFFTANIPTEEVFTMPHRDQVEGVVRATKPLSYKGTLVEDFSLAFEGGRVVSVDAKVGEAYLKGLLDTDEGARHLGEIALLPHSSPISQSGLLFYNTLIDENSSHHIALGRAYRFTMQDGSALSEEEFQAAGGNVSQIHVDFMIGSAEMDVDGVLADGSTEPIMRQGEWAFTV